MSNPLPKDAFHWSGLVGSILRFCMIQHLPFSNSKVLMKSLHFWNSKSRNYPFAHLQVCRYGTRDQSSLVLGKFKRAATNCANFPPLSWDHLWDYNRTLTCWFLKTGDPTLVSSKVKVIIEIEPRCYYSTVKQIYVAFACLKEACIIYTQSCTHGTAWNHPKDRHIETLKEESTIRKKAHHLKVQEVHVQKSGEVLTWIRHLLNCLHSSNVSQTHPSITFYSTTYKYIQKRTVRNSLHQVTCSLAEGDRANTITTPQSCQSLISHGRRFYSEPTSATWEGLWPARFQNECSSPRN